MTSATSSPQELETLLNAMHDQGLDEHILEQLEMALAADASAQDAYIRFMELCTDLHLYFGAGRTWQAAVSSDCEKPAWPLTSGWRRMGLWTAAMAAAAALVAVTAILTLELRPPALIPSAFAVAPDDGVAVLTGALDAEIRGTQGLLTMGAVLQPGRLELRRGLIQIEFYSGAAVVLEAPADFQIMSPKRIVVSQGRIRAHVPPHAQGFTVGVPGLEVVDLGTEFGLSVKSSGDAEIHVFEGEVKLERRMDELATSSKSLTTGQALRLDPDGREESLEVDSAAFIGRQRLASLLHEADQQRHSRWRADSRSLQTDPDVILHYTFEDQPVWDRTLRNRAATGGVEADGVIVGAQWSRGRWAGKSALEFKRTSDRIRFSVPGEYSSMTFATWVRFDGFDRWLSALMLTDDWDAGEPHWQVSSYGEIILGVREAGLGGVNYYSDRAVLGPEHLGRWVHLATVYDGGEQQVTHYLDGRAVRTQQRRVDGSSDPLRLTPLSIGDAEIGNWMAQRGPARSESKVRNLNGRLDEFLLFRRALSPEEILDLYRTGRP